MHKVQNKKSTKTTIPFFKNNNLDYSSFFSFCGPYKQAAGWVFFVFLTVIVVMAVSNGANLNDGMDGMTAGNSAIIGVALGLLAYVSSHIEFAGYLNIMYIPGTQELVIFASAFVGALIGFLWYNAYPAQIFMGENRRFRRDQEVREKDHEQYRREDDQAQYRRLVMHIALHNLPEQMDPACSYMFPNWPKNSFHEAKITTRFWIATMILAAATIITLKIR